MKPHILLAEEYEHITTSYGGGLETRPRKRVHCSCGNFSVDNLPLWTDDSPETVQGFVDHLVLSWNREAKEQAGYAQHDWIWGPE